MVLKIGKGFELETSGFYPSFIKLFGYAATVLDYGHCHGQKPSARFYVEKLTVDDWQVVFFKWFITVSRLTRRADSYA